MSSVPETEEDLLRQRTQLLKEVERIELKLDQIRREKNNQETTTSTLSLLDVSRYSRQLLLPELSVRAQIKLKASKVLLVGCGGLGCPSAQYLAAAGIGTIGLIDFDEVEVSNLHR